MKKMFVRLRCTASAEGQNRSLITDCVIDIFKVESFFYWSDDITILNMDSGQQFWAHHKISDIEKMIEITLF